jgi:hypothetical protein
VVAFFKGGSVFLFFQKKVCLIRQTFAGLFLFLLTSLLVVSCPQPDNNSPPPSRESIVIFSQADMAKIGIEETHPLSGDYLLANDVTLENWLPIGDETSPFTGVFDGKVKIITLNGFDVEAVSGKTYLGIFGYVKGASDSAKGEIKNLAINSSVDATSTCTTEQAVGIVAGWVELAEIENITLAGTFGFRSEKTVFLGGAAGWINGEGTLVKNIGSSLEMNIVPGNGVSGILASGYDQYTFVGGIVGTFRGGAGIENCHNTGDVTADNVANSISGQLFVGGIAGGSAYAGSAVYHGYIKDSSFIGTVIGRARGYWTFAGGIAGTITGGNINDLAATTRIEHCFTIGTVSTAGTSSGSPYVGGVVGYIYYGALVSQSYFDGEVIAAKAGDYTGGIAGYNSQSAANSSRIEDCWSGGIITGFNNAGGIVGQNQANAGLKNSYSIATVSTTSSASTGIGGIAGFNGNTNGAASVTGCVALNPSLAAPAGNNIHRVTGNSPGAISNSHAWSGMAITTGGMYAKAEGATAADGADCDEKPNRVFYEGLGWDFSDIWTMGTDDDYPQLRWQQL